VQTANAVKPSEAKDPGVIVCAGSRRRITWKPLMTFGVEKELGGRGQELRQTTLQDEKSRN
jgi:hypothetical protein